MTQPLQYDNFVINSDHDFVTRIDFISPNDNFVMNRDHHEVTKSRSKMQNDNKVTKRDHHEVTKSIRTLRNDNFVIMCDGDLASFWTPTGRIQFCMVYFLLSVFISYIKECESLILTESHREIKLDRHFMTQLSSLIKFNSLFMTKLYLRISPDPPIMTQLFARSPLW